MTAETDLLPLPDDHCGSDDYPRYDAEQVQAYARACVSSATEALRAEVERLTEYARLADEANANLRTFVKVEEARTAAAEARAERLAEALRELETAVDSMLPAKWLNERLVVDGAQTWSKFPLLQFRHDDMRDLKSAAAQARAALDQETTNG